MKAKDLKRIENLMAALLLASVLGCGQSKQTETEPKEAAPPTPATTPAAPAEKPAAAAAAAPAATPATTPAPAAGLTRWDASPTGSTVKMEGTSTLHDWHMDSTIIGGFIEADPSFPASVAKASAQAFMPVRSFKSSGGKKMDQIMQEKMSEPKFKRIEYTLIELKPKGAAGQFDAVGALTIIGNTVTNTMPVTIEKQADGKLKVTGSTPLKMTDYKLPPPTIKILGADIISVGDDLKISFEWLLAPKA